MTYEVYYKNTISADCWKTTIYSVHWWSLEQYRNPRESNISGKCICRIRRSQGLGVIDNFGYNQLKLFKTIQSK